MLDARTVHALAHPLDYRLLGSILDRMTHSGFVGWQLRAHLTQLGPLPHGATVCLFGSVARGEMDLLFSDVDLMFLGCEEGRRGELLRALVEGQRSLNFHGAADLLERFANDAEARAVMELRFPLVASEALLSDGAFACRRRMQFVTEASPIAGPEAFADLTERVVSYYALIPRSKRRQTPQRFIADLDAFNTAMRNEVARQDKDSQFFAKYLLVREIGQHFTRLGLVAAVFSKQAVLVSPRPAVEFARILRQPALEKLLFWVGTPFLSGRTLSVLKSSHGDALLARLGEARIDRLFLEAVFGAAKAYSDALDVLHEPSMRCHLEASPPNVLNWRTDPDLQLVVTQLRAIGSRLRTLGEVLAAIFELADEKNVFNRPYRGSGLEAALDCFRTGLMDAAIPV